MERSALSGVSWMYARDNGLQRTLKRLQLRIPG